MFNFRDHRIRHLISVYLNDCVRPKVKCQWYFQLHFQMETAVVMNFRDVTGHWSGLPLNSNLEEVISGEMVSVCLWGNPWACFLSALRLAGRVWWISVFMYDHMVWPKKDASACHNVEHIMLHYTWELLSLNFWKEICACRGMPNARLVDFVGLFSRGRSPLAQAC